MRSMVPMVPVAAWTLSCHALKGIYPCCGWLCRDFCFEGSCELCQFEVEAGAQELGNKAQPGMLKLQRVSGAR